MTFAAFFVYLISGLFEFMTIKNDFKSKQKTAKE